MIRAIRRHHKDRMKRIARKKFPHSHNPERYADNPTTCSGYCCGNRRRYEGATDKERESIQEDDIPLIAPRMVKKIPVKLVRVGRVLPEVTIEDTE